MSKPSDRKREKQKERQRADAKKKYHADQRRLYAQKFPEFVYHTNGAPPEFVRLVQQAIKKIDFRDPKMFSVWERDIYKLEKQHGPVVIRALIEETKDNPVARLNFICQLGHLVFSLIPQEELRRWIPHHDLQIIPGGREIKVIFRSLQEAKGPGGTIYYSRFKPRLNMDGERKIVAFSQHAIERVCERIVPRWYTYTGLGDAFAFFDQCIQFQRSDLPDGQLSFTFYDQCRKGFFTWKYVEEVLGESTQDDGHYYRRVGYCPAVIEGDFVKAKTLLFPGHKGTPEYPLVWASDVSVAVKMQATDMNAAWIEATQDFRLVKFFHQRGVTQVIHDEREFFKPSI